MTKQQIREAIVNAAVKNLKAFGYPHVTAANISTDTVYAAFFKGMLEDESNVTKNPEIEAVRRQLLDEFSAPKS